MTGAPMLESLGLRPGDKVRYQRTTGGHWQQATVERRERDGSVGVRDSKGASRALKVERLEVRTSGPRGAVTWEPVAERASRTEQMELF
jgi:hypothetical protein